MTVYAPHCPHRIRENTPLGRAEAGADGHAGQPVMGNESGAVRPTPQSYKSRSSLHLLHQQHLMGLAKIARVIERQVIA